MTRPTFSDIQKLFRELVIPFYEIERDLPLPIQDHRNENDAEHSWTLALGVCALAPRVDPDIDVGRACMLAVVHDMVEIYAGDTSVWAPLAEHDTKQAREEEALSTLKKKFPMFPTITDLIEEYEGKKTLESQFVWALDKFLALLVLYEDAGYYYLTNKRTWTQFTKQHITHRKKAHAHTEVGKYYDELYAAFEAHPEYFHPS
jgi:5'-deoxynucleotidase YfbR-like HD superfamily hydrolase